jgi:hypothetical protein
MRVRVWADNEQHVSVHFSGTELLGLSDEDRPPGRRSLTGASISSCHAKPGAGMKWPAAPELPTSKREDGHHRLYRHGARLAVLAFYEWDEHMLSPSQLPRRDP